MTKCNDLMMFVGFQDRLTVGLTDRQTVVVKSLFANENHFSKISLIPDASNSPDLLPW